MSPARLGTVLALAATTALGSVVVTPAQAGAAAATGDGPGCHPSRPAVAHYAGGVALSPQPATVPVPCGMPTGYAGGESAIAVTNSGAVLYAPAVQSTAGVQTQYFLGGNSGFARTIDLGKTWGFVDPISPNADLPASNIVGRPDYPAWDQIDDKFYMDRSTGRLFWADPDVPTEIVVWTDDDGLTWGYSPLPVGFGGEWTQVTTAKPRTSTTSGYPSVVYACGEYDSLSRDFSPDASGDLCQKSLDGGQIWITAGQGLWGSPTTSHAACQGQSEHPNFSPWAAPDSQGRLYELLFCAGHTLLIRSDDEGATWPVVARVPYDLPADGPGGTGSAELRTDSADNLYLAWDTGGNANPNHGYTPGGVDLSVSRDGGRTWSAPAGVLAPGVVAIGTHFGFDIGAPGQVALSYLGHTAARVGYDGYITEPADALAARPVFYSGVVNNTAEPALDLGGKGSSNGMGLDYVSAAIGPDGTPWASFWDACGDQLPQAAGCPADRRTPNTVTFGYTDFAGRLTGPAPSVTVPAAPVVSPAGQRSCASFRRLRIHLHVAQGVHLVRATVTYNATRGRVTVRLRGRRLSTPVNLTGLPRGTVTVHIRAVTRSGRVLTGRRVYHTCVAPRPHRHRRGL